MKLSLKEGWLVCTMVYSDGRKLWEFTTGYPDCTETYDARTAEFIPAEIKRIIYSEAEVETNG
jgi:hypothetical protein